VINKVKKLVANNKNKKLISNFSYLSFIAIVNKLLPLAVLPYIVRTIGVEKFGTITFAWALISFFILITKYSFVLTAVKHISLNRDNKNELSSYVWTVFTLRIFFAIIVLFIFLISLFVFDKLHNEIIVMLFTFIMVFADVLMPMCFFRGIEEMKYIAIFNLIAKILYTVGIFIFIHHESDYIWIPLLNGLTTFIISLYAMYYIHKKYKIVITKPKLADMIMLVREGKDIFISNLSVSFYTTINPILLGILGGYTAVGIYSLAESIYSASSTIIKSFTMVIHPHLARYTSEIEKLYRQARKFFYMYLFVLINAAFILYILSGFVITLLYGEGHSESVEIMQILALALLLEPLGNFFTFYLSLKTKYSIIRNITFKTMILNLILVVPMIHYYQAKGLAYLFLLLSVVQVYLNSVNNKELFTFNKKKEAS